MVFGIYRCSLLSSDLRCQCLVFAYVNNSTGIIWKINDQETRLSPWVWQGRVGIVIFWWWNVKGKISRICKITETNKIEKDNNMHRIIGIIDGLYIVQTPKGLKKVKVIKSNRKNVRDEIENEKL